MQFTDKADEGIDERFVKEKDKAPMRDREGSQMSARELARSVGFSSVCSRE
jgi:hypothetical protein